tara:strand:+ start:641 stop:1027 length:387 start_codon:yes stop_codon:yes gene_type:complete
MADYNQLSKDIDIWLKYNDSIDKLNNHVKVLKEKKNNIESSIISTMENHNLTQKKLKINEKHVHYNISHTMPPLSLKLLDNVLNEFMTPKIKEKILEKIQLYREQNKTQSINLKKKNINRKKSNKKSA